MLRVMIVCFRGAEMSIGAQSQQLMLNVRPRLAYSSENFVVHAGVKSVIDCTLAHLGQARGHCLFVHGQPRSGKTHLTLRLAEEIARKGAFPRLFEPEEFSELLSAGAQQDLHSDDVLIVDDVQQYFANIVPGESGPFVNLIEGLRARGATIVLLSELEISALPCDAHVLSRLRSGTGLVMGAPAEEDLPALIGSLARQRGIALRRSHVDFLVKRVAKSLPWLVDYFERLAHLSHSLARGIGTQDLQSVLPQKGI